MHVLIVNLFLVLTVRHTNCYAICFMLIGKLKLVEAKPMEKKSVLTAKVLSGALNKDPLPPITSKRRTSVSNENKKSSVATAYQVTFDDNDQMKTKKNSKFNAPLKMNAPARKSDDR